MGGISDDLLLTFHIMSPITLIKFSELFAVQRSPCLKEHLTAGKDGLLMKLGCLCSRRTQMAVTNTSSVSRLIPPVFSLTHFYKNVSALSDKAELPRNLLTTGNHSVLSSVYASAVNRRRGYVRKVRGVTDPTP